MKKTIYLSIMLILVILFGCTNTPSSNIGNQEKLEDTSVIDTVKKCGSDFECVKSSLKDCTPMIADINFRDPVWGNVRGTLQISGSEKDTYNQRYGCGADYETQFSSFHKKHLKGHLIIEKEKDYDKLVNLILSIEGYLEGSGQVITEEPKEKKIDELEEEEDAIIAPEIDFSNIALDSNDLKNIGKGGWTKKFESEINDQNKLTDYYISENDRKDGWLGGYKVEYKYQFMNLSEKDFNKSYNSFTLVQLVFAFPIQDGKINSSSVWVKDDDEVKFMFANFDASGNYGFYFDTSKNPSTKYEPIGVGENEFVYSFQETQELRLYGIVFTKEGYIQRISIYGMNPDISILNEIARIAAEKIDQYG